MTPGNGRHHAQDGPADRARIDYLSGEPSRAVDALPAAELDDLDDLRALLADPTLWAEPPAELEDSVVAAIAAEAAALPPADRGVDPAPDSAVDAAVDSVIDSPLDRPTETVRRPDIAGFGPPGPHAGFPAAGPPVPAPPVGPTGPARPPGSADPLGRPHRSGRPIGLPRPTCRRPGGGARSGRPGPDGGDRRCWWRPPRRSWPSWSAECCCCDHRPNARSTWRSNRPNSRRPPPAAPSCSSRIRAGRSS